jgi:serine/threonine-protein kinase
MNQPHGTIRPEDYQQVREVFEAALKYPAADRVGFVERACRANARLIGEVHGMLKADAETHPLLDGPLGGQRLREGDRFANHFEIGGTLGRGGMGEVYLGRDTKLNREVAIKVLPSTFTGDPDRLARFRREAQVLASLNHPNIGAIYSFEESDGIHALALEYVEGPTLADRIARGPIPLETALSTARQIAEALEAAHEQGIVHRDLKPGNVKLRPDGVVKVLDFGLAKPALPSAEQAQGTEAGCPEITSPAMTAMGMMIGTPAYMSPEQVKGRAIDRRADIWAFGAVLYEMLSGRLAFHGEDVPETLAAVLQQEVDWSAIPGSTPAPVRNLIARCLERDPRLRLRDIGEARILIESPSRSLLTPGSAPFPRRRFVPIAVATTTAAVATVGIVAVTLWPRPSSPPSAVTRFALTPPADRQLLVDPQSRDLAITRDGTRIIYKGGARIDRTQLFVQRLDQLEPEPLTPMGLPKGPFVSPDGQWVGFFEPGPPGPAFKKVPLTGGPPVFVSRLDGPSRGATWIDDGTIIAASGATATGLLRLSPAGGDPVVLTRPNRERGESDHLWPQVLPGGRHVLFTITALTGGIDAAQVAVLDLASGSWRPVVQRASQAQYVASGHLLYVAGGALWAIAFDPARAQTLGTARVVVPQVVTLPTGVAEFDVADDGTLVYLMGNATSAAPRNLVWVDRQGREDPIDAPPKAYVNVRLSPDGTRAAVEIEGDGHDIWVWDFTRKSLARVTTDPGTDQSPVWMPDGRRLVFTTQAGGVLGALAMQAADGSGTAERLRDGARAAHASFALADGSGIIFSDGAGPKLLRLDRDHTVSSLLTPVGRGAGDSELSPDERWMAYVVADSDAPQVFVTPFPDVKASRTLVTPAGGTQPRWARDGSALFYTGLDGTLMSVTIDPKAPIRIGRPVQVLTTAYYGGINMLSRTGTYDVARDGRFLMLKDVDDAKVARRTQIVVVRNWIEELKRLVPVGR